MGRNGDRPASNKPAKKKTPKTPPTPPHPPPPPPPTDHWPTLIAREKTYGKCKANQAAKKEKICWPERKENLYSAVRNKGGRSGEIHGSW